MNAPLDLERKKQLSKAFKMPTMQNIMSRKTSITNAFVSAVIPVARPTLTEIGQALCILGMEPHDVRCAYCGDKATEWDHLRPLVIERRPTGFVSEIANLVPSCGKCNQSKGNKPWREWIVSNADLSPTARGVTNLQERIARLESFERWLKPTVVDFKMIVGKEVWEDYWLELETIIAELQRCQTIARSMKAQILQTLPSNCR
jgi:hypothetical protein